MAIRIRTPIEIIVSAVVLMIVILDKLVTSSMN